ncbi:MAG: hypothetical protein ACRD6I_16745 [Candidatus Acidiferrales bacterium]
MLFHSEHITAASGSVGGVTYSHSRSGMYRRARSIPVNPNTTLQTQVRAALTAAVTRWTEVLTAAQRTSWDTYGANVPITNALGAPFNISGQNWYIAANTPRLQSIAKLASAIAVVDPAPTMFDRGDFTTPGTPVYSVALGLALPFSTLIDAWSNEDGAAMLIFQGRPRNPSRQFFAGPYRLIGAIEGDSSMPPASPKVISSANISLLGYPLVEGQLIRTAVAVTRADGRISTRRELPDVTANV